VAETANPQRMGAAHTYARRHRISRYLGQGPSENLAHPQQAVSNVLAAVPLRIQGFELLIKIPIHARRDAQHHLVHSSSE
jgi:hypothetical protein